MSTLLGVFAVMGERQGRQMPMSAAFPRRPFRSRSAKPLFSTTRKSDFYTAAIFDAKYAYFAPLKTC